MSRGVNKVILVGNLGQDIEVRYMPSGGAIASATLATSVSWKDKNTGEQKEHTEWHRLVFSNRLAEIAGEYLKKGSKIYAEGALHTRKWQNQQGQDQYTTGIRVKEMQMLDSKPAEAKPAEAKPQQASQGYQQNAQPKQQAAVNQNYASGVNAQQPNPREQQQRNFSPQEPNIDFDDDIPFMRLGAHAMWHLVV